MNDVSDAFTKPMPSLGGLSMLEWNRRTMAAAETLPDTLPDVTRFIIANDIVSGNLWYERAVSGEVEPETAVNLTGSYARLDVASRLVSDARLSGDWFLDHLPELWRGSDPDDTDDRWLSEWRNAWHRNGRQTVYDDPQCPLPRGKTIRVYRGQLAVTDRLGIAWSTKREIAQKFANGASFRVPTNGVIITGRVPREKVLAYLTGREEYEVICDPADVV